MSDGLMSKVVGGFQVQGVYQVQSGAPLNFTPASTSPVYLGANPADSAWNRSAYKASISGPGTAGAGLWFDRSKWVQSTAALPNVYQIRTFAIRFYTLRADRLYQFDFGVQRNFAIYRGVQMQIRVDAINALNHPVYTAPSTDWTSSSFGQITTAANQPRVLQFGGFLRF